MSFLEKYKKNSKKNDNIIAIKDENFKVSQHMVSIGSWTRDLLNNEIYFSDEVYNILECSTDNFDGNEDKYYLLVHPDDLEDYKKTKQEELNGVEYDIEYRIITPNGTTKYVHEKTTAIYDENKKPIKMVGVIHDITIQKIVENNLKEIGEDLNKAQRVCGVGSWKYDAIKDINFWSDEVYYIFNIDPTKFDKSLNNLISLVHAEDQLKFHDDIKKGLEGKAYKHEYRIPQPDGTDKYVISKGEPIFDINHCIIGIIGTIQDITENKLLENKLVEMHKNLAVAQELSHIGSWKIDFINGKFYCSEEHCKIFGISTDKYNGNYEEFLKHVHPDDKDFLQNIFMNSQNSQKPNLIDKEFRIKRTDGSIRNLFSMMEYNKIDKNGNPSCIYGTTQDITEQKKLQIEVEKKQNELIEYSKRFQVLVQESSDVFEIIEPDGTIKYISEAVENVIGYKVEERIGKNILDFYEGKEKQTLSKMIELVISEPIKKVQDDIILISKTGEKIYLEVIMKNSLCEPAIQGIVINFRSITQRVAMEKRMAHISTHDELTDLPNKIYFKKKLRLQCEYAKDTSTKFALMMLEIDGFKNSDETIWYEYENHLFIDVVKRLKEFLGSFIFISRISEYKLAIIVHGLRTTEGYENIAKGLIDIFKQQFIIDKFEISLSINIGICVYPDDSENSISIAKNSNIALLRAIKDGKNKYKFFSSGLDIQYYKEFVIRNDLHKAIENNQLKVYYQPIVNLKTNEIIATEALIRWEHPEWGILSPDEFIPLAEESGAIIEIGKWILKEVCRNYKKWIENKRPSIKVSVNLSSIQFFENDFVENIKSIIDEFMLNPHFLIMEITESILINKVEKVTSDIRKIQSYGIQIALDDFGTGYSSLVYLNSFNIDILKIDKSFIDKVVKDKTSSIIIKTIINMAKELNIKLVTEGIENWEQLTYLRGLNCYSGQGFIYSKPLPLKYFDSMLAKGKCKPTIANNTSVMKPEDRRKFFRISFHKLLESDMTVINLKGKNVNVGNNKVLIKNLGPGGLCFASNIKLPIDSEITLLFKINLLNKEFKVYGHPLWIDEYNNFNEYGIEFTVDENERVELIKILNQVQIKMKKDILFAEGSFVSCTAEVYFNSIKQ
ncbi:MAG: EAL domain-containing protein [Sedimentibacter sp.]